MADISKIKLPSGTSYDIKDSVARSEIETKASKEDLGGVRFSISAEGLLQVEEVE